LLVLPGAVMFGALWQVAGSGVAFATAAVVTAVAAAAMAAISVGRPRARRGAS
jgi:hypothetical protein